MSIMGVAVKHIEDVKPITARQCIKLLPLIAKNKPELKSDIVSALKKADISIYADSMQPLVCKDIQNSMHYASQLSHEAAPDELPQSRI